jgi:CheY-like chemotaxis protein
MAETPDRLSGMNVLIVDDVDSVREVIREMLEMEGATVVEACTAHEALELTDTLMFDVVLTDLGLPDVSGEAVIAGVRSLAGGRIPVAVVSGADPEALARAAELGADRIFRKPVDREDLIRYVASKRQLAVVGIAREGSAEADMTVLIIEDDHDMRALLRDVLEREGYRVIGRKDGVHLPALVESERFDVAIVDKELPGPSGLELVSFLQERLPAVPVILVTAFGGPDIENEATRRGAYSYVEKPFRVATILDALAAVSTRHRKEDPGPPA